MRALILLPVLLAACGERTETAPAPTAAPKRAFSNVQNRVLSLTDAQRHGVFLRAIRDGDKPCQGVAEDVRQDDQGGNPVWVARCTDDHAYAIAVDRNGVAQVATLSAQRR